MKPVMSVLLVTTNALFLICYIMFFGTQSDQLACKSFEINDCGHQTLYSLIILTALLPLIWQKSLAGVGYFSAFCLIFTFAAIIIILVITGIIASESVDEANNDFEVGLTEENREWNYWSWTYLPVFCASMNALFEGN
jgi:amino acid permease